jgi:hypothetical protein
MKKTLVSFTISFACLISFCTFANADILQSWNITTTATDTNAWKVAKLLQAKDSAVAGVRADITDTVFKNYLEGYSTVANPDKTLSKGANLTYVNVKHFLNSITSADATIGQFYTNDMTSGVAYAYTDSTILPPGYYVWSDPTTMPPGYYAYQTTFSLSPEISDLSGLFLNINLDITADNYLEGIFLNGQEIAKYSSIKGAEGYKSGLREYILDLTGSVLLEDLVANGLFLSDDVNTLEFVVRNRSDVDNPTYLGTQGSFNISDEQQFSHSFNPTPEPATLLICLTCGGLALAIRRKKNKKTE